MPITPRSKVLANTELRRKGIYLLPNLFTTAALFGGFFAIVQAMNGKFEIAAVAIFIAMVLDGLDGRVARMTHTQSAFGAEYDSLSDMVSFGVAPALASALHCDWRDSTPRLTLNRANRNASALHCDWRDSTPRLTLAATSVFFRACRARRLRHWLPDWSG